MGRRNRKLHDKLLDENAFHYKVSCLIYVTVVTTLSPCFLQNIDELTGFAGNKVISESLQGAWFSDKTSPGVEFSKYFKPISLVTLAFILTTVCYFLFSLSYILIRYFQTEFCIGEWRTGQFVKTHFTEKAIEGSMEVHLKDLKDWNNGNPDVVGKIRMKLFERAL